MRSVQVWTDTVSDKEKNHPCIYDIAFHPSGDTFIATAGNKVLVYDVKEGKLLQTLKGHRDSVNCLTYSRDGLNFASGGADKVVIIWTSDPPDGRLKYTHSDSVQCISFNPVSQQLVSCTATEVGLWSPEQKSVTKSKILARACCCCWTNDGQYFAVGHYSGVITIWTKSGEEKVKIERPGGYPVWSLSWNPSREDQYDILTVCDWGQKLSYYYLNGKQISKDRTLGFDPTCVSYFPNGEFAIITGSSKKASVYSKEGVCLGAMAEQESWVWTCRPRPGSNNNHQVVIGCQDGTIALYQMTFNTVHGLYKDRYAYRESMTEVVVNHLITNDSVRLKCHDLVKKIAIYRDRLAVQFPDKFAIYELTSADPNDLNYKLKDRIMQQVECSLLVVCSNNIVLCQDKKLQCLSFSGEKEREWILESQIRYIKVVGGPPSREGMLVGLRNGQVFKIFIDNPFPIPLFKQQTSVRCLDLSASRNKLVVVDDVGTLSAYNLPTKELLYQEPNANSVAWNTQYEDMLCFSGAGLVSIKANNFPVHQQRQQGFVVGFSGSRIFCLLYFNMSLIDVPQSASMIQYLERKNFREAYKIACLGVTDGDWRVLALEALEGMDLDIAKKAFIRVRDLRYLELIHSIEERKKRGENNTQVFLADVYAYQGKFQEAAQLYRKAGQEEKAVEMYTDLCQFDLAKQFASSSGKHDVKNLITKQADWAKDTNDPRAACDMYLAAGEFIKAIEIMGQNGWVERILNLVHDVDKSEKEILQCCVQQLKRLAQFNSAAEVLEKLGDIKALVTLHIETQQWHYAFELAKKYPEYKAEVYMPYATWLVENDRFEEAQDALNLAGKQSEAASLLKHLAENAVTENRFGDAGYYYWILCKTSLEAAKKECHDPQGSSLEIEKHVSQFHSYMDLAELYYVYYRIYCFVEQPFTSHIPDALHNMSRFLVHRTMKSTPRGISKVSTYFTLAKQSRELGAYKLARYAYEKLQTLVIPASMRTAVNMGTLTIRAKPPQDKEDLLPMCYRCSSTNPLINNTGNECINCKQPFEFSFISFEVLPVVEFVLEDGISDEEAMKLILKEPPRKNSKDQWKETQSGNVQSLKLDDYGMTNGDADEDPFSANTFESAGEFTPVVVGRKMLESLHHTEVLVKKWSPPIGNQYYRSILPDVSITICSNCNKMFHTDDYELQVLLKGHCPFCRKAAESLRT